MYTVITENDESEWDDRKGEIYHFPKRYLKNLQEGTHLIYYKGGLKNSKYRDDRMSSQPHYFGIGTVGKVWKDPNSVKGDHFCTIQQFQEFTKPVLAKLADGAYYEQIPESRIGNYWRDGVRPITKEIYDHILETAELDPYEDLTLNVHESQEYQEYQEGNQKQRLSTYYERNPALRKQVLLNYKDLSCAVCEFNFEATYGEWGKGFIHVHHLNPVSQAGITKPDPHKDFALLCPNCHAMVHRKKDRLLSIEELKQLFKN
ncbi:restriction endonuclease [Siphonobacter sp. BAB-5385]|uniref:HNH endonuclease n=1 Tax=Siphonobacter sp. BAB-5385 TaxID=1864822 RepID=UPI000B9E2222|nr:HNH endonuclease [Siphonobacter sp. BAB-5385]OZI09192.1 restriction endonuclease [Siphonobacter sp. BAB-5385]